MCWQRPAAASRETAYQPHLLKGNGCRKARGHKSDHLWRGLGHREHMLGADHSPLCTGMAAPGGRQHKCTHTAGQQQKHALAAGPASSRLGQARQAGRQGGGQQKPAAPANPPYVIVATGWPGTMPCTSGAAAATTPTASKPASNGSLACAILVLPKYLHPQEARQGKAGQGSNNGLSQA
jgi:hypothetical protein